uniref:Uncharacterized protein n=1 Tax=Amazona collaria TaxID=241587 RepID=A0A8B9G8Y8_9PSIT
MLPVPYACSALCVIPSVPLAAWSIPARAQKKRDRRLPSVPNPLSWHQGWQEDATLRALFAVR